MSTSWSREAAYVARVTAGATHEVRNVLAIVKESAGLVADLLHACAASGTLDRERLLRALSRIDAQTARGAEQLTQLNRFAHALDADRHGADLAEELERVAFFGQRLARARSQEVRGLVDGPVPIPRAEPVRVQMAIFEAVEHALAQLPDGASLELRAGASEGRPHVDIQGRAPGSQPTPSATDEPAWSRLREALESLGASVEAAADDYRLRIAWPAEG
jgi:hypothetical protein